MSASTSLDWTNEHLLNLRRLDHPKEYVESEHKRMMLLNPKLLDVPDDFDPFLDDPEPYMLMHDHVNSSVSGVYMRVAQITRAQLDIMVSKMEAPANNQRTRGRGGGGRVRNLEKFLVSLQERAIEYEGTGRSDFFYLTYVGVTQLMNVQARIDNEDAMATKPLRGNPQPFLSFLIDSCREMNISLKTRLVCPQGSYVKEALAGMMLNVRVNQNTMNRVPLGGSFFNRFMFIGRTDNVTGFWTATGKLCTNCNPYIEQVYQPLDRFNIRPKHDPTLPECSLSAYCQTCLTQPSVIVETRKRQSLVPQQIEQSRALKRARLDRIVAAVDLTVTEVQNIETLRQSHQMCPQYLDALSKVEWKLTYEIPLQNTNRIAQINDFAQRFGTEQRLRQFRHLKELTESNPLPVTFTNSTDPIAIEYLQKTAARQHLQHVLQSVGFDQGAWDESTIIAAQQKERLGPGVAFRLEVIKRWEMADLSYRKWWLEWKAKHAWTIDAKTGDVMLTKSTVSADRLFSALLIGCRQFLDSYYGWSFKTKRLAKKRRIWSRSVTYRIDRSRWDDVKAPLEQALSTRDTRNECNDVTGPVCMKNMSEYYRCDNEETNADSIATTTSISADDDDDESPADASASPSYSSSSDDSVMSTERIVESQKITRK